MIDYVITSTNKEQLNILDFWLLCSFSKKQESGDWRRTKVDLRFLHRVV